MKEASGKKDLQVDHIQSWSEFIEFRFDINNCRTVCKSCHYFITFGKKIPSDKLEWGHNLWSYKLKQKIGGGKL